MAVDDVAVVIAYRDMGVKERAASFAFVHDWYSQLGWPILVEAGVDDATFGRAAAINAAVARSGANIIVQTDPDNVVPLSRIREAVDMARLAAGLVLPYDRYVRLNPTATAAIIGGAYPFGFDDPTYWEDHGYHATGGTTVFSLATWIAVRGLDERFGLWGGDDAAFSYSCGAMVGPTRRIPGDMVHLWHPVLPQSLVGSPGYVAQFAILAEYRDAAAIGSDAVRALVENR